MIRKNKSTPVTTEANLPAVKGATNVQSLLMADAVQGQSGFENMGADDIAIPFICVLQALSPQIRGATKIKGAEEGDFFNTVTSEIYKGVIELIPCAYQKAWVEWKTRASGGGFIRQHMDQSILDKCTRNELNQDIVNGTQDHVIVATAYHYCLLLKSSGGFDRVVLSFTSTQLKKSRRWNSQMMNLQLEHNGKRFTPPMYSHIYQAQTVEESNDQGQWAGWDISSPRLIEDANLYLAAKKFHDDVTKGAVKTTPPPEQVDAAPVQPQDSESEHF